MKTTLILTTVSLVLWCNSSCYLMRKSDGGGQIGKVPALRSINPDDIVLPPGYRITRVASDLTFPSAVAFDDKGQLYVIETGYSYGEVWRDPKLLRVNANGSVTEIAKGDRDGPWTGVTFHKGNFYLAEGGQAEGGKILRISPDGSKKVLVDGLPSVGDHHTNGPVIMGNHIYFGQGTATNSGVVGTDNASFGWLARKPDFHEIPCKDITLVGQNFTTDNPLTPDENDKATTGAFLPFGTPSQPGQVIKGRVPCNGAIMRIPLEGGKPELVAWGMRNPFGLSVSPEGKLFVTDNGYDDRGSRPVWGTADILWEIEEGKWYGWPDYSAGDPLHENEEFKPPGSDRVKFLLANHPNIPPRPKAILGVHASSNGFDFSRNETFGHVGEAFIAEFGDMSPGVGKVLAPVGYKVVRVNPRSGVIEDFAVNKGKKNGPASWIGSAGLERPVSVKFDPTGTALYIVDFGIMKTTEEGPQPQIQTGVIWKVTKG